MPQLKLKVIDPDENFFRNNITFTSVQDIKKISESLLADIDISYFTFDRTYKDGSHIRLTNSGEWIESYYRQRLYEAAIFEKDHKLFTMGHVFWSWLNREPVYSAASEHNIDHGLTIIQPHDAYTDFFHFGVPRNNPISPEMLLARLDCLYHFVVYFKEKAQKIISNAENNRIILSVKSVSHISLNDVDNKYAINDILKKPGFTRLYLGSEFDNMYLTKKEVEVLGMLCVGEKTVDIAKKLNSSERTLEYHVKQIKDKFNCHTLFELGFLTAKLNIQHIFPFRINSRNIIGEKHGVMARHN